MKTTIQNIFQQLPSPQSLTQARQAIALEIVHFNGSMATHLEQEVEVGENSVFKVGRSAWHREMGEWIQLVELTGVRYLMQLRDAMNENGAPLCLKIQRSPADGMLMIGAEGYGEKTAEEGCGFPIVIELYNGEFRLLVWSDINDEEPTHVISLEGAREDAREPED